MTHPPLVLDEPRPGIARIRLNRPGRLNSFTVDMVDELGVRLAELNRDPGCRVVVLTGTGRGFCTGVDLQQGGVDGLLRDRDPIEARIEWSERLTAVFLQLRRISRPVVAAVNGLSVGGGFSLALLADLRVAGRSARFADGYIRNGLSGCELGTSYLLPRLVGAGIANELLLTGREVDAEEAARIGLVSRVVDDEELQESALDLAASIAEHSPFAVAMTKQVIQATADVPSLEAAMLLEMRTQMLAVHTADSREARAALMERRPPAYGGYRTR